MIKLHVSSRDSTENRVLAKRAKPSLYSHAFRGTYYNDTLSKPKT